MTDLSLRILLQAQDQASKIVGNVGDSLKALGSGDITGALKSAGSALLGIGEAAVGVAAQATSMAADYEQTMNKIQALAGVSKKDADAAAQSMLNMAEEVGQSPQKLADGLYYIAGAGFNASDSMKILEESAKAATVGMTDTETTANAATAVLKATGMSADQTTKLFDEMTVSVSSGKVEWADYANVIGRAALAGQNAGVTFEETTSALSDLTNTFPSVRQAQQALSSLLTTSSRFDLLASRADALGISFDKDAYSTMNLKERIQYLNDITGGNAEQMGKLLGQQNAVQAATALSTNNFKDYDDILNKVKNSSGAANDAFDKVSQGLNVQTEKAKAGFDALMISLGQQFLPILTDIMSHIGPLINHFMEWDKKHHALEKAANLLKGALSTLWDIIKNVGKAVVNITKFFHDNETAMNALRAVLITLGLIILAALVPAFVAWAISAGAAAIATMAALWPILLIGAIAAAIIFGIIEAVQHWGEISKWLQDRWNDVWNWIVHLFQGIGQWFSDRWHDIQNVFANIGGWFHDRWNEALTAISNLFGGIGQWFTDRYNEIKNVFANVGTFFKQKFDEALQKISNFVTDAKNKLQELWNSITQGLGGAVQSTVQNAIDNMPGATHGGSSPVKQFAGGVRNFAGGLAIVGEHGPELVRLSRGTDVLTNAESRDYLQSYRDSSVPVRATSVTNHITITIDGRSAQTDRDLVEMLKQELSRELNRSGNLAPWIAGGRG